MIMSDPYGVTPGNERRKPIAKDFTVLPKNEISIHDPFQDYVLVIRTTRPSTSNLDYSNCPYNMGTL